MSETERGRGEDVKLPFLSAGSIPCVREGGDPITLLAVATHSGFVFLSSAVGGGRISRGSHRYSPLPPSLCVGGGLCGTVTHYSTQEKKEKGEKGEGLLLLCSLLLPPFLCQCAGETSCCVPYPPHRHQKGKWTSIVRTVPHGSEHKRTTTAVTPFSLGVCVERRMKEKQ